MCVNVKYVFEHDKAFDIFLKLKLFIKQAKNEFQCLNSNNLDVQTLDEQGGISMEVFRWL